MVNTLFASKVMYVNQLIIMFWVCCHRLAEGGVEWLGNWIFKLEMNVFRTSFFTGVLTIDLQLNKMGNFLNKCQLSKLNSYLC